MQSVSISYDNFSYLLLLFLFVTFIFIFYIFSTKKHVKKHGTCYEIELVIL
jgi:hypothetical protein